MARIPEGQVERIKREVSLERLVQGKGVELSRKGRDLVGLCPFHEEDTASLIVSPAKNLFHCMGCGAAGSVIDWVMRVEGVSFRHAVELLTQDVFPSVSPRRVRASGSASTGTSSASASDRSSSVADLSTAKSSAADSVSGSASDDSGTSPRCQGGETGDHPETRCSV